MYIPADFEIPQIDVMHQLIKQYALGILFTHGMSGLDANHLPFELSTEQSELGVLHAHVSRQNPIWQDIKDGDDVLVVFRAGDAYISPQWYPSKHEHHQQVPTWNYMVIHAYGKVKIHDDERYVRGVVARLTRTHEAIQAEPWKMSDAPKDYLEPMLKEIVGIEIKITKLQGKAKLGQNKEYRDVLGVANALTQNGQHAIGGAMHQVAASKKHSL
ncbi:FMN-binding negative transcriptional regulator [Acinetobacter sp. SM34]|uniref:FMN-binding negative transcriptional regulator n=1 Tax=Acinetobacter sp. SM34 TaxID=1301620 RepID=UPI001EDBCB11|nr:FMN-binding negative transcriptional regulator [Acinetobacter sp. SM34]MCG2609739.1 FMN-binding negative transcriptional regulator [Acinetobacter sp. SM34]